MVLISEYLSICDISQYLLMNIESRIPGCGLHIADVRSKLKINIIKQVMRAGGRVAWLGQLAQVLHHPAPVWLSSL